jgi:hypothetical protein
MKQSEILSPDAKSLCMKKTTANLRIRNVPTNRYQPFAIQLGVKIKPKIRQNFYLVLIGLERAVKKQIKSKNSCHFFALTVYKCFCHF